MYSVSLVRGHILVAAQTACESQMICKILRRTTRRSIMRRAVPRRGDICTRRKCRSTPPLQVKAPRQRYMPPSPYDKQRRYISYGNKRHTVCPTHLKEDIRSTPCPYRARITCRFCPRCNDSTRRENPTRKTDSK